MPAAIDILDLVDRTLCAPANYLTLRRTADGLAVTTEDVFTMVRRRELDAEGTPRTGSLLGRWDVESLPR